MCGLRFTQLARIRLSDFVHDSSGGFILQLALAFVPLALIAGGTMDYVRQQNAQSVAQSAADAAALAAAVALSNGEASYEAIAREAADVNLRDTLAVHGEMTRFSYDEDSRESQVVIEGRISTTFLNLIAIGTLPYSATSAATSGMEGSTEVALVLDNTFSMNVQTSMGMTRIAALKDAAGQLVTTLTQNPDADVSIGVVPYVNYVNVGLANRNQPWITVPANYVEEVPEVCRTTTSQTQCVRVGPPKTCQDVRDGVVVREYECYDTECTTTPTKPTTTCRAAYTINYQWFGCVRSRTSGLHVTDGTPNINYVGFLETTATSAHCRNAITPLSDEADAVRAAIAAMDIGAGNRPRDTYIPAGLLWGLNLLTPTAPFEGAKQYDPNNDNPRKAIVLMTDGANTLAINPSNGQHLDRSWFTPERENQTYADMLSICTLARSRQIEVYTVAFEVTNAQARETMQTCASSPSHYFDASNAEALFAAFDQIARSLMTVRLVR